MTKRTQIICMRPLAREGSKFSDEKWEDRIEAGRSDLICDLPALRVLTASTLVHEIEVLGGIVHSVFSIQETGQFTLPLLPGQRARTDAFHDDLERILLDQIRLRERYENALKTQDVQALDGSIVAIRQRLYAERGKGEVTLHSSIDGERFNFDAPPRVLPKSPVFWIEAKVTDLNAQLVRVEPCWERQQDVALGALIGNKKWLDLRRSQPAQGLSAGLALATALELKQVMSLKVAAEVLWVDASTKSFVLLELSATEQSEVA